MLPGRVVPRLELGAQARSLRLRRVQAGLKAACVGAQLGRGAVGRVEVGAQPAVLGLQVLDSAARPSSDTAQYSQSITHSIAQPMIRPIIREVQFIRRSLIVLPLRWITEVTAAYASRTALVAAAAEYFLLYVSDGSLKARTIRHV